jgi:hypothetical protein
VVGGGGDEAGAWDLRRGSWYEGKMDAEESSIKDRISIGKKEYSVLKKHKLT